MKTLYVSLVTNPIIFMLNKVFLQLSVIVNGGKSKFVYAFNRHTVYYMCLNITVYDMCL